MCIICYTKRRNNYKLNRQSKLLLISYGTDQQFCQTTFMLFKISMCKINMCTTETVGSTVQCSAAHQIERWWFVWSLHSKKVPGLRGISFQIFSLWIFSGYSGFFPQCENTVVKSVNGCLSLYVSSVPSWRLIHNIAPPPPMTLPIQLMVSWGSEEKQGNRENRQTS